MSCEILGRFCIAEQSERRSLAFAEPYTIFVIRRSISKMPVSDSVSSSLRTVSLTSSSTAA